MVMGRAAERNRGYRNRWEGTLPLTYFCKNMQEKELGGGVGEEYEKKGDTGIAKDGPAASDTGPKRWKARSTPHPVVTETVRKRLRAMGLEAELSGRKRGTTSHEDSGASR